MLKQSACLVTATSYKITVQFFKNLFLTQFWVLYLSLSLLLLIILMSIYNFDFLKITDVMFSNMNEALNSAYMFSLELVASFNQ